MPTTTKPRKSARTSAYYKRKYKARYKSRHKAVSGKQILPAVIPDRKPVKLKYHGHITLTPNTALPVVHIFRSSLNDPDYSGVGHQPMGHDEWSVFYNRYRCYGFSYRIRAVNVSTSQGDSVDIVCVAKPNVTSITSNNQLYETTYSRVKTTNPAGSGNSVKYLTGYVSVAKTRGISNLRS